MKLTHTIKTKTILTFEIVDNNLITEVDICKEENFTMIRTKKRGNQCNEGFISFVGRTDPVKEFFREVLTCLEDQ